MQDKHILGEILINVGETRKGVESLEREMIYVKQHLYEFSSRAMLRDECKLLHSEEPKEKLRGRLQRSIYIATGIAALLGFLGSTGAACYRYIEKIDSLTQKAEAVLKKK